MSEYRNPISPEMNDLVIERALDLRRAAPELSLDDDVRKAVAQTICACVLEIEGDLERHLSGTHAGMMDEVRLQVELRLAVAPAQAKANPVDEASENPFRSAYRTAAVSVSLGSSAFEDRYSFGSRFEDEAGTNPEELLGAAHASCFSIALSLPLTEAGYTPTQIKTLAKVWIERSGNGFAITHIELMTEGDVPGLDARTFSAHAEVAKRSCPVSKALAGVDIALTATLVERSGNIVPRRSKAASAAGTYRSHEQKRKRTL